MIHLRLLGTVELRSESEARAIGLQPKRLALLAYLAASPHGVHRRDTLLGLFWPELESERARGALSKALHYLRRAIGEGVLLTEGDEQLRVDPARLWCDVAAFEQALGEGRQAEALDLYRGDLLQGFFLSDAPGFERWVEEERERLRRCAAAAGWALAGEAEADGKLAGAIEWARRAQAFCGEDEASLRRLLTLLEGAGDRAGAVRTYEDFARRLREELELEPSAETQALIARLRETDAAGPPSPARGEGRTPLPARDSDPFPLSRSRERGSGGEGLPSPTPAARIAMVGAVAILALVSLAYLVLPRDAAPALDPQRVVVAPFENRTGQATLDPVGSMATDWIIQGLSHTGLVEVVPFSATLTSARFLSGLGDASDNAEPAQALARETGAGIVVSGSYYLQGDSLYLQSRISDAVGGRVLVALEPVSASTALPLAAVEELRQRIMAGLAPHLNPRIGDYARIISRTPSYDAYREYAGGMEQFIAADWRGAIEHFARAAAHDSAYTLPLVLQAIAYANLGNYAAVDSLARLVEPRRERLAEYDRQAITAATAWGRGDYATSYRAAVRVARLAPNTIPHGQVARELLSLNRPREALKVFAELDPGRGELRGWPMYWENLTMAHHLLGQHRRELQAARRAREQLADETTVLRLELRALAALGRVTEVRRALDEHLASPGEVQQRAGMLLRQTALELHAHGHAEAARQLFDRSLEWYLARPAEVQETPGFRRALGEAFYLAGRWPEAEQLLSALAAERPRDLALQGRLGTLAARRGVRAEAERISDWLEALERPYLLGEHTYWRARIAALSGERETAVTLLREAYAEGRYEWLHLHTDPDLESLRTYPPFRELLRPKG